MKYRKRRKLLGKFRPYIGVEHAHATCHNQTLNWLQFCILFFFSENFRFCLNEWRKWGACDIATTRQYTTKMFRCSSSCVGHHRFWPEAKVSPTLFSCSSQSLSHVRASCRLLHVAINENPIEFFGSSRWWNSVCATFVCPIHHQASPKLVRIRHTSSVVIWIRQTLSRSPIWTWTWRRQHQAPICYWPDYIWNPLIKKFMRVVCASACVYELRTPEREK